MTVEMLQQAFELLERAAVDDGVRVVVLTGAGNTFCAGADLAGASDAAAADSKWSGPKAIVHVLNAILEHPKPVIARVQGHVAGGGNGLVAACDLSVAVESAKFAFSEVRLGVAPAVISVVCLDKMNVADGFDLLLTGERVSAARAKESGLLNKVVEDEALDAAVATYVDQLRRGGPKALAATKQLLQRVRTMDRTEAFNWTAELSANLFASEEAQRRHGGIPQARTSALGSAGLISTLRLPQTPAVLPFSSRNWLQKGQHGGVCEGHHAPTGRFTLRVGDGFRHSVLVTSGTGGVLTLGIDCGGSGIKGSVLDAEGEMVAERIRIKTPYPLPPERFVKTLKRIANKMPEFDRVTVGMPGMIRNGRVIRTPHYPNVAGPYTEGPGLVEAWRNWDAQTILSAEFDRPTRVMNDAEVQGAAVIQHEGLEVMFTLGTGLGCAVYNDGRLAPHLEMSHAPIRKDATYDTWIGIHKLRELGPANGANGCSRLWRVCARSSVGTTSTWAVATPGC